MSKRLSSEVQQQQGEGEGATATPPPPPPSGVRRAGRRKIVIEFIEDKSRRHITFSKRKAGIMKKAYELSTLTGTQVLLLVASETGHVYTFATPKLQPLIVEPEGQNLIQVCLNSTPVESSLGGGPSSSGGQRGQRGQFAQPPPPPPPSSSGAAPSSSSQGGGAAGYMPPMWGAGGSGGAGASGFPGQQFPQSYPHPFPQEEGGESGYVATPQDMHNLMQHLSNLPQAQMQSFLGQNPGLQDALRMLNQQAAFSQAPPPPAPSQQPPSSPRSSQPSGSTEGPPSSSSSSSR